MEEKEKDSVKETEKDNKKEINEIKEEPEIYQKQNSQEEKEDSKEINEEESKLLYEKIISYMGGPNISEKEEIQDISYSNWVEKNEAIKHLCEPYEVIYSTEDKDINEINNIILNNYKNNKENKGLRNPFGIIENHDFACELKLLKWITEDEKHKNNFISMNNIIDIKLNTYSDILPYKYNIVNLDNNNEYINASFITNPLNNKNKIIIATQTPLKNTINTFWKIIYKYKIKLIIMLSDIKVEYEKNKIYFPQEKDEIMNINEENKDNKDNNNFKLKIQLMHKEEIVPQMATLKIFKINDEFEIKHIQITSWPEKGLPGEDYMFNVLIEKILKHFEDQIQLEPDIPITIHCHDGVGRTGTLISIFLIIMCLKELKKIKKEPVMGVFNVVRKLREQRYASVTDVIQYKYIYDFALYWIKKNYPLK